MQKRWVRLEADKNVVRDLQESLKIHPVLCKLLAQRGIRDFEQARQFFRPSLDDLHDPMLMKDMDKAVERINTAVKENQSVLIYGDYDVDGTTSVALVYQFIKKQHPRVQYYIPDRYKEGYGISQQGIEWAKAQKIDLIIALDCGIRATGLVELAKSYGIDFIICDHHIPGDELPPAVAILDPKQPDCTYPYKELSGCGIGFKLMQAWAKSIGKNEEAVYEYLDLVAVSIASDIVPMTGENRILATFGIKKLEENPSPGFRALMKKAAVTAPVSVTDIVFGIGPRINAAGRMDDAAKAVRMLAADDRQKAEADASELNDHNAERKLTDRQITEEALEMIQNQQDHKDRFTTVVCKKDWHKGVVGIVASRLIERYHRPTIVFTSVAGMATGSARSVRGFDIHAAISSCADILDRFGGHRYAAGLSLKMEYLQEFCERFEKVVRDTIDPALLTPELQIDSELEFSDIQPRFYRIVKQFGPFGPGNMSPVFISSEVHDTGWSKIVKEEHLKLTVRQKGSQVCDGIAFGRSEVFNSIRNGQLFDIAYQLEENTWKGETRLQLQVKDIQNVQ